MTDDTALTTPDGRQLIVRGRLWRTANPGLGAQERQRLVNALKDARRSVKASPDFNRYLVKNTPYAAWFTALVAAGRS